MAGAQSQSLLSMTGFGRAQGRSQAWAWTWEIRAVNSKSLDLRLRVPQNFEAIDALARPMIAAALKRGACSAALTANRDASDISARVNGPLLRSLIEAIDGLALGPNVAPARLDGLLALKGIVDFVETADDASARERLESELIAGLRRALDELMAMRAQEGAALKAILVERLERIASLVERAEQTPGRSTAAIKARLARAIALLGETQGLDAGRLHQEAVLMASKADIREEIDRLKAHCAAARALLENGGAIGRRLDFLAQEFGRETNTLCAKSNDSELTAIGLDLKVEVEQWREQVQNVE